MYATWHNYGTVTNMGTAKEVLSYTDRTNEWWRLSSPSGVDRIRPLRVAGDGTVDISVGYYTYGARPALYH